MIRKYRIQIMFLMMVVVTLLFYSYPPTITFDSSHYLKYLEVISGATPWSSWDAVRGPVFPFIIHYWIRLFGLSTYSVLNLLFISFLVFIFGIYYLSQKIFSELFGSHSRKKIFGLLLTLLVSINPIIFGYFHTFLTESIALALSPWIIILILKRRIFATSLLGVTLWFLKQPYVFLYLFAELGLVIYHLRKAEFRRITQVFSRLLVFMIVLFSINFIWEGYLISQSNQSLSDRGSSSIVSGTASSLYMLDLPFLIERTSRSFLGITNITESYWDGIQPVATYNFSNFLPNENGSIGYRFTSSCNVIGGSSSLINPNLVSELESCQVLKPLFNSIFISAQSFTNILFSLSIALSVLIYIPLTYKNKDNLGVTMIGSVILFYTLFFSVLGTSIDRYLIPIFPLSFLYVTYFIVMIARWLNRRIQNH